MTMRGTWKEIMAEVKAASLAAEQTCLNWRSCFRLEERGIYIIYRIYIIMYIYIEEI